MNLIVFRAMFIQPAAFRRLCVETFSVICTVKSPKTSRLQAAVC